MWIRNASRFGAALFLVAAMAACTQRAGEDAKQAESGKRPNILFILADDLGYADLGVFGSEIPTPNLDALAKAGLLLTDFHSAMACSPTRAMLMSGTDHHLAGLGVMGRPTREDQKGQPGYEGFLNFRVASLADLMTDAGYNTYMTGKWHLGEEVETGPRARGFKRSFVSLDGAAHLGGWDWRGPTPAKYRDGDEIVNVGDDFYTTRFYTERMIEYIEQDRAEGKPFFAYLAYTAPHWPLQAPKESIAKFKGWYDAGYEALYAKRFATQKQLGLVPASLQPIDDARFKPRWSSLKAEEKQIESRKMEIYAAMVSDLDTYIGEVVTYLKKIGEFDNTLIMFMSDNGTEPDRRDLKPPISRPDWQSLRPQSRQSRQRHQLCDVRAELGERWRHTLQSPQVHRLRGRHACAGVRALSAESGQRHAQRRGGYGDGSAADLPRDCRYKTSGHHLSRQRRVAAARHFPVACLLRQGEGSACRG